MRKFKLSILLLSAVGLIIFTACPKKEAAAPKGRTEISEPFSSNDYFTDAEFFRATGQGTSPNLSVARKIAETNARRALADEVQTKVKGVTDSYIQQRDIGDATEVSSKFEDLTRTVVNQELQGAAIFDRKTFQEDDGKYTHYVAIQMPIDPIKRGVQNQISQDAKLRQDYDKAKFEEVFNDEMNKLKNEQQ